MLTAGSPGIVDHLFNVRSMSDGGKRQAGDSAIVSTDRQQVPVRPEPTER